MAKAKTVWGIDIGQMALKALKLRSVEGQLFVEAFDVIEDVLPLFDVAVSVRVPRAVKAVRTAPDGRPLPFDVKDGRVHFTLPRLDGHEMVSIEF